MSLPVQSIKRIIYPAWIHVLVFSIGSVSTGQKTMRIFDMDDVSWCVGCMLHHTISLTAEQKTTHIFDMAELHLMISFTDEKVKSSLHWSIYSSFIDALHQCISDTGLNWEPC